jgi:SNF2 family DNA or RNA helicase
VLPITLRRTKDQEYNGRKLIELPPKTIQNIVCKLDEKHREFYTLLDGRTQGVARFFLRDEEERQKIFTLYLVLVLRLKQGEIMSFAKAGAPPNEL